MDSALPPLTLSRRLLATLILTSSLALSGCESAEDKAEAYYQSGLALLEAGDEERAMLEFRNVFNLNGFHKEARQTYADLLLARGEIPEAYGQYLRLIEQYPDTAEVRQQLAEIAIDRNDWDEAQRHGAAAITLAPDTPRSQAIDIVLRYRQATIDGDQVAADAIAAQARSLLESQRADNAATDNAALVRVDLDNLTTRADTAATLDAVTAALVRSPDALDLNMMKVQLLSQSGDIAGVGLHLQQMATLFPDNPDVRQNLIRWYMSQGDTEGAIEYLRELAGPLTGETDGHLALVQFVTAAQGPDAARAELNTLLDANTGTAKADLYASMLATLDFDAGQTQAGIDQMRAVLDNAAASPETQKLQITLAQMLNATGDRAGAEALVTTVLEQDASNVEALKLQAGWLISEDRIGEAIVALRTALNQSPQDSQTLTLMAQAHERDGDLALAGERLSLAVQAANAAPAESLRYAGFLANQGRLPVAITVLEDARQQAPRDLDLLTGLADLYIQNRDWAPAQRVVDVLRDIEGKAAQTTAPLLQAAIMQGQNRMADSLAILETQVDPNAGLTDRESLRAVALIVQTQIRSGKIDEARAYLDGLLATSADNADLQALDASLSALEGDLTGAEDKYRALAQRFPQSELPVRFMASMMMADGRSEEALVAIDAALPSVTDQTTLLLIKASILETAGDIDGAIATYEQMYAQNSDDIVVANNLASLISAHRDDADSLARATTIARRLRGTDVPAFADTYGWIMYRRGNIDEALTYLVPAAAGLQTDPMVQFHLGMAYAAAGQTDRAHDTLSRAVTLSAESPLPQFQIARETLSDLQEGPAANLQSP